MLRTNPLKQKLENNLPVYGLLNSVPSPWVVEMMGYAGYDFVILDLEHLSTNPETLEHLVRAAECAGITPLVRVPGVDPQVIMRVLDCGAMGVVVPRVRNRSEAECVVRSSRYFPMGERGITGGRTTGFGTLPLETYFQQANQEILVVVMIEDQQGVENCAQIADVEGVDWILEGAIDLSQSYGQAGQAQHPDVQNAIASIAQNCLQSRTRFCAVPRISGQVSYWYQQGVRAFLLGEDRGILFRQLKSYLQDWQFSIANT